MKAARRIFGRVPGIRHVDSIKASVRYRYCRGVFSEYGAALAAINPRRRDGYDNDASAMLYINRLLETKPSDYAAFFWLKPLLPGIRAIFDFGGNLGWSYYSFRKYLHFPEEMLWTICDVPAVTKAGRELARRRGAERLSFTTEFGDVEGSDLLLTSGTLQYIGCGLAELLRPIRDRPTHLLINRVPMTEKPTFFTVQDIGPASCPYRICNRDEFVAELRDLGYSLIDSWRCPESRCSVLFRPSRRVSAYTGIYLRLSERDR